MEIARAKTNEAVARANNITIQELEANGYNPEWRQRKTCTGRNYNGGKSESPYAEDSISKAGIMGFFVALFAFIFFCG